MSASLAETIARVSSERDAALALARKLEGDLRAALAQTAKALALVRATQAQGRRVVEVATDLAKILAEARARQDSDGEAWKQGARDADDAVEVDP